MDNTKQRRIKGESIERTVDKLRKRFSELLPLCGGADRLAKRLAEVDPYFDESLGYFDVKNAKRGKAGEEVMIRIVSAMERIATPIKTAVFAQYQPKYEATQKLKQKFQEKPKP